MTAHSRLTYLQRVGLLSVLGEEERLAVLRAARVAHFKRREPIFYP